jgi:hypothetical protein
MLIMAEIACQNQNEHLARRLEIHDADDHTLTAHRDTEHGYSFLESEYSSPPFAERPLKPISFCYNSSTTELGGGRSMESSHSPSPPFLTGQAKCAKLSVVRAGQTLILVRLSD